MVELAATIFVGCFVLILVALLLQVVLWVLSLLFEVGREVMTWNHMHTFRATQRDSRAAVHDIRIAWVRLWLVLNKLAQPIKRCHATARSFRRGL